MRSVCWWDCHSLSGLLPECAWLYLIEYQMNVLRDAATIGIAAWAMTRLLSPVKLMSALGRWWLLFQVPGVFAAI